MTGGVHPGHGLFRRWTRASDAGLHRGHLHVCRVVAAIAGDDGVLPGIDEHLKLRARGAADRTRVGLNHAVVEPHPVEDPRVRLAHDLVARTRPLLVRVEGVRVFHGKLTPAKEAPTRAGLVSELGLDLVEILGQVSPALDLAPGDVGDDLLVRRAEVVVAALAVLEAKNNVAVKVPPPGLLEVLGRQERRHQDLEGAGSVHLATDDRLHVAQDANAERQVVVNARADAPYVPRACEEHVARVARVGGSLFHGGDQRAREEHGGARAFSTRAFPCRPQGPRKSSARWKS